MNWVQHIRQVIAHNRVAFVVFIVLLVSFLPDPLYYDPSGFFSFISFIFVWPALIIALLYAKVRLERWWKRSFEQLTPAERERVNRNSRIFIVSAWAVAVVYFFIPWLLTKSLPDPSGPASQLVFAVLAAIFLPAFLYAYYAAPEMEIAAVFGLPLYIAASVLFAYYAARAVFTVLALGRVRRGNKRY